MIDGGSDRGCVIMPNSRNNLINQTKLKTETTRMKTKLSAERTPEMQIKDAFKTKNMTSNKKGDVAMQQLHKQI